MEWFFNIVFVLVAPAPFIAGALITGIIVLVMAQLSVLAYRKVVAPARAVPR